MHVFEDGTYWMQEQDLEVQRAWMQATLQEREQLAGELHDRLSQTLACLSLQAQTAQLSLQNGMNQAAQDSLSRLILNVEEIQKEMCALIGSLLSVSSSVENFGEALQRLLENFQQQTGLTTHLMVGEEEATTEDNFAIDLDQIPAPAAMQLVRIAQEALSNARRHAVGISQVIVRIIAGHRQIFLSIEDDGEGFDPSHVPNDGQHFGLKVMRQRAERLGGQTTVYSVPGKGTRIEVCLPLADD